MYFEGENFYHSVCYACGDTRSWLGKRVDMIFCGRCESKFEESFISDLGYKLRWLKEKKLEFTYSRDIEHFNLLAEIVEEIKNYYVDKYPDFECMHDVKYILGEVINLVNRKRIELEK